MLLEVPGPDGQRFTIVNQEDAPVFFREVAHGDIRAICKVACEELPRKWPASIVCTMVNKSLAFIHENGAN